MEQQKKKRFTQGLTQCFHCGKSTVLGNFCTECGEMSGIHSIELKVTICPLCGEEVPERHYCVECGADLLLPYKTISEEFKKSLEER